MTCTIGGLFVSCILYADDIVLMSSTCYGLHKLINICTEYGNERDIKVNPDKSQIATFGGSHPAVTDIKINGTLVNWAVSVKYLGCTFRCHTCETDASSFVGKFYGAFNNIINVLGTKRNEMTALHLARSYCSPLLLYSCEIWLI